MNVQNNKRRKESQEKIEKAFIELLQSRQIKDITVSDLIKLTGLNRSTFYANFEDISAAAALGRNKANIYAGDKVYQLKGDKRFNALKYVNMYYHYKFINKGEGDEQFLGL